MVEEKWLPMMVNCWQGLKRAESLNEGGSVNQHRWLVSYAIPFLISQRAPFSTLDLPQQNTLTKRPLTLNGARGSNIMCSSLDPTKDTHCQTLL